MRRRVGVLPSPRVIDGNDLVLVSTRVSSGSRNGLATVCAREVLRPAGNMLGEYRLGEKGESHSHGKEKDFGSIEPVALGVLARNGSRFRGWWLPRIQLVNLRKFE